MTKILFTDVDGTLLTDDKQISSADQQAIREMTEAGHKIVLTSGRALPDLLRQADKLSLNMEGCYVIAYNGGEIYDCYARQSLFKNELSLHTVSLIFDIARSHHICAQTFDNGYAITYNEFPAFQRYCREIGSKPLITDDITGALEHLPSKILYVDYEDHDRLVQMQQLVLSRAGSLVDAFFSAQSLLEIVPKGTNKGKAIKTFYQMFHLPYENTISVGDGINDITMFHATKIGVAMANAVDEVKREADYVTRQDNNHSGLSEVIHQFVLR